MTNGARVKRFCPDKIMIRPFLGFEPEVIFTRVSRWTAAAEQCCLLLALQIRKPVGATAQSIPNSFNP